MNLIHTIKQISYTTPLSFLGRGCRVAMALMLFAMVVVSCSEEDNTVDEYANWQQRNDEYFERQYQAAVQKINNDDKTWRLIRVYSKTSDDICKHTDYVIAHVISQAKSHDDSNDSYEAESPEYTDSVLVHYRGHLMPTEKHPQGFQFDSSWLGDYNTQTMIPARFNVKGVVIGFISSLMKMHVGDRWEIIVPYPLGYNNANRTSVPAYSTMHFDITLTHIGKPGKPMPIIR